MREGWDVLASDAGADPALCGLASVPTGPVATGGYSYLHRDVPVFAEPIAEVAATGAIPDGANEAILAPGVPVPRGYHVATTSDGDRLVRRRGSCGRPPPSISFDLGRPSLIHKASRTHGS
jgi:hypothetical protein